MTKYLQELYGTSGQYHHLHSDITRISKEYLKNIEYSHAEMAYDYLNGVIDEKELEESVKASIEFMQDFWDDRFEYLSNRGYQYNSNL